MVGCGGGWDGEVGGFSGGGVRRGRCCCLGSNDLDIQCQFYIDEWLGLKDCSEQRLIFYHSHLARVTSHCYHSHSQRHFHFRPVAP